MSAGKLPQIIAAGFFFFWLIVLYGGADHPPPPGFVVVLVIDLCCSLVVYFRVSTYMEWLKTQKEKRGIRVFVDGLAAGVVIAILTMIIPGVGEPGVPVPAILECLIWILILAIAGAANALIVYGITAFLMKRMTSAG
jgi:hypothetical protein